MGSSPMVPQKAEQSQLLVQQPDAPSPAQPQVHCVIYTFGPDCNMTSHNSVTFIWKIFEMTKSNRAKLCLIHERSPVSVTENWGFRTSCSEMTIMCSDWNNETMTQTSHFSLIFLPLCSPPLSVCFLLTLSSVLPLGISSTAYRWASAADGRRWPRWAKAAFPWEESGCSITLQAETQTVGQFPGEEGWGALHLERLTVGKWAWSGWAGRKRPVGGLILTASTW